VNVFVALCFAASLSTLMAADHQKKLQLKVAGGSGADARPMRAVKRLHSGRSHILVEYDQTPTLEQLRQASAGGLQIVARVADVGLLVTTTPQAGLDLPGVVRAAALASRSKFSPLLHRRFAHGRRLRFLVELHPDIMSWEGRAIALREGLVIHDHPDLEPTHLLVEGTGKMAAGICEWDEVAYVFPASADLWKAQPAWPCAGTVIPAGWVPQYVATVGPGWDGPGRGTAQLTFSYERLSDRLLPGEAEATIERAFHEWSRVIQVGLLRTDDAQARRNINILFAHGDYGGPFSFDGEGGRLAQAFYPPPPSREPIAGDIHFDADEAWNIRVRVDLFSVALHEFGHALGLGHSDNPDDVMYPYYRQVTHLSPGDIASVRQMYAPRRLSRGTRRPAGPTNSR
jgi:hypothetical protein